MRIAPDLALLVEDERDENGTGNRKLAALLHRAFVGRDKHIAIEIETAIGHLANDLGGTGRDARHQTVPCRDGFGHLQLTREGRMLCQMTGLAMHGDSKLGPHPLIHMGQLVTARMAGDMHEMIALGDDGNAALGQAVLQIKNRGFVAGDNTRGEDDRVAFGQGDIGVTVLDNAGESGTRLALTAGADEQHFIVGDVAHIMLGEEWRQVGEIARLARGPDETEHGTAHQHDMTIACLGGTRDGLDAGDIGGKGCDGNAAFARADRLDEGLGDIAFGTGCAGRENIGAVADHGADTLVANGGEAGYVHIVAEQRIGIYLPVARMHDGAKRRADGERIRLGDRMGERDKLDVEGPERDGAAKRDNVQRYLCLDAFFQQLGAHQRGGERRGIDRATQTRPEMGNGADVIFMRVGKDEAEQVIDMVLDVTRVGHDEVYARRAVIAEGDTEIDHDPLPRLGGAMPVEIEIHTYLAGPA